MARSDITALELRKICPDLQLGKCCSRGISVLFQLGSDLLISKTIIVSSIFKTQPYQVNHHSYLPLSDNWARLDFLNSGEQSLPTGLLVFYSFSNFCSSHLTSNEITLKAILQSKVQDFYHLLL